MKYKMNEKDILMFLFQSFFQEKKDPTYFILDKDFTTGLKGVFLIGKKHVTELPKKKVRGGFFFHLLYLKI